MLMQSDLSVRKLLKRRQALRLLSEFVALVPELAVALLEPDGAVYVQILPASVGAAPGPEAADARKFLSLDVNGQTVGALIAWGPGLQQPLAEAALTYMQDGLGMLLAAGLESRSLAQETLERYREINLLYNIGETIGTSLDPDAIPHLVLAEASRIIETNIGGVFLLEEHETLSLRAAFGSEIYLEALTEAIRSCLTEALADGQPRILTADQLPPQFAVIQTVVCAPMKTRERVLGFVALGRLAGQPVFIASDEKLLLALASQAAISIENARLFADVKQQRDAIAEMKNYMDNIFASIASGVITTDIADMITIINRAAEHILGINAADTMGRPYKLALPELGHELVALVDTVKRREVALVGYELQPVLPERGPVSLRLHLSPLKDNHEQTTGIAIVVDDLTEQKQLEAQVRQVRQTFERYVQPQVVEQLLSDPASVRLGGVRQEISILFADLRNFTSFGEKLPPEILVEILNQHLTLAAQAVLAQEGTLDKFVGDAVMALFNAPLPQLDHTLRAVRAAWNMQRAIEAMHADVSPSQRLSFGIGIVTGPAVVGNVGSPALQNYTAIGDSVSLASRLQNHAQGGQIFLDVRAYERIKEHVLTRELGYIHVKGHTEPDLVFEVVGLR